MGEVPHWRGGVREFRPKAVGTVKCCGDASALPQTNSQASPGAVAGRFGDRKGVSKMVAPVRVLSQLLLP